MTLSQLRNVFETRASSLVLIQIEAYPDLRCGCIYRKVCNVKMSKSKNPRVLRSRSWTRVFSTDAESAILFGNLKMKYIKCYKKGITGINVGFIDA